jgi:hypothetical protein
LGGHQFHNNEEAYMSVWQQLQKKESHLYTNRVSEFLNSGQNGRNALMYSLVYWKIVMLQQYKQATFTIIVASHLIFKTLET